MAQCTATAKATGLRCGRLANRGTTVCRVHGGNAPGVRAKAIERLVEEKARAELGKLAALLGPADPVEDPLRELLQLGGEARRWKELLAGRVAELTSVGYEGIAGEQLRAEVAVFERALDRLAGILATIARLNIDERLAKISEQQTDVMLKVVTAIVEYAQLTGEEAGTARRIAVAILRGQAPPRVEPAASRVVEVRVPVPTAAPPRLERLQLEAAPAAAPGPFVVDVPAATTPPSSPPPAPPPATPPEPPPAAADGSSGVEGPPQHGVDFWRMDDGRPPGDRGAPWRRPW